MNIELSEEQIYLLSDCILQSMHDIREMEKNSAFYWPLMQGRITNLNNLNSYLKAELGNRKESQKGADNSQNKG